jgi:hypothetical protein
MPEKEARPKKKSQLARGIPFVPGKIPFFLFW